MSLHIDGPDLAACVACGLCLPHCPTYRVTGEERASPRGRIAAMRAVEWGGAAVDDDLIECLDSCVQCRGCDTACPSGVPFGRLMEGARQALADQTRYQPRWRRAGYRLLGHHRLLLVCTAVAAVAQRLGMSLRRLGLPRLPIRQPRIAATGHDVWLFTGCVMDAWQRPVHGATLRVLSACGLGARLSGPAAGCCGALAAHAGLVDVARAQARSTVAAMPGDAPVVVASAGCGAQMKDYGHLLGTAEGQAFAARVRDVHELLAERPLPAPRAGWVRPTVAVQDPCHLRHVQRAHQPVRVALAPYADLVELDDEGLCCGAGGAYSVLHPATAAAIRGRKLAAIARSGAPAVASANPGCQMWLTAAGVTARHPIELIDEALHGR